MSGPAPRRIRPFAPGERRPGPAAALKAAGRFDAAIAADDRLLEGLKLGVPLPVAAHPNLSAAAKAAFSGLLVFHSAGAPSVRVKVEKLADSVAIPRRSLRRSIEELRLHGFLLVEERTGRANVYHLFFEARPHACAAFKRSTATRDGAEPKRPRGVTPRSGAGQVGMGTRAKLAWVAGQVGMPRAPDPVRTHANLAGHEAHEADNREAVETGSAFEASGTPAVQRALPGTGAVDELAPAPRARPPPAHALWLAALEELRGSVSAGSFGAWLKGTTGVEHAGDVFTVAAPNTLSKEWIDARLRGQVEGALCRVLGRRSVVLQVIEAAELWRWQQDRRGP